MESVPLPAGIQLQIGLTLISGLLLYGTWIHAEITVKSFQDFFYYQTKHPGITVHTVFSEKHQSEHVEFRAVDKVCNLFGAEFCDMKRELLLRGVVDRGILLKKKKQLFLSSKDF